ncbi:MAG: hypothetical protein M1376_18715 [Planctomycetes bacterium]|nr:hypothetical protein [Planctomycetota bacterium]
MGALRMLRKRMQRHNSPGPQGWSPQFESLESRLLLSADTILPGITPALSGGLASYAEEIQTFVDQEAAFQTAIPGILQVYQDTNGDGKVNQDDIHVPSDVTVKVDQDKDGVVDAGFLSFAVDKSDLSAVYDYVHESGVSSPTLEEKLNALDSNNDAVVDWDEAYRGLFVGGVEEFLQSYADDLMPTVADLEDDLTSFLSSLGVPTDLSGCFNLQLSEVADNTDTGEFGHSYTLTLTLQDRFLIDLGLEAEQKELLLPDTTWSADGNRVGVSRYPDVLVSETITMPFAYHFETSAAPLTVDDFNFAAESVFFSLDADESLEGLLVNVGFLGTQAPAGSNFFLNMDYRIDVIDPSSPRNLGFADEEPALDTFRATETDGVLEAANEPRALEFTNDIFFTLTIGGQSYSPTRAVTVGAATHADIDALAGYIQAAVDTALGADAGLITVDVVDGRLRLSLPTTDPAALGFGTEAYGANSIEAGAPSSIVGSTSNQEVRFLLSLGGAIAKLIDVTVIPQTVVDPDGIPDSGDEDYAISKSDLLSQLQEALDTTFGADVVVAADSNNDDRIELLTAGTLEITNTLTMEAVNNITYGEWTTENPSPKPLEAVPDTGSDAFTVNLPLTVREGIDFAPTGTPTLAINVQPFDLSSTDVALDTSGVERYHLPLILTDFEQYLDFNVMGPGEVIGLVNQLVGWLDRLPATEMLGNFRIPFAKAVLGDVLDFGDVVADNLLIDDADDGIQPADAAGGKLLRFVDDPNSLAIVFGTAQELAYRLNALGVLTATDGGSDGNAADDLVDYDEVNKCLLYQVSLEHPFSYVAGDQVVSDLTVPVDFDLAYLDLYPLNNLYSPSRVSLSATGEFEAVLGIVLGQAKTIDEATGLNTLETVSGKTVDETIKTELALTGAADAATIQGRLTADQKFTLQVTMTDASVVTETITINRDASNDNTTYQDLIDDINDALPATLSSLVAAKMIDSRIQLVAIDPSVQQFKITSSTEVKPYSLYQYRLLSRAIVTQSTQLGLNAGPAWTVRVDGYNPVAGTILVDALGGAAFAISINGEPAIPFSIPEDDSNNTVSDLVDDLNAAINGTGLAGRILAAQSNGAIVFLGVDESVEAFRLVSTGVNKLGFSQIIEGEGNAPTNGQLAADAAINIAVTETGGLGANNPIVTTVTVAKADTETNTSLDDLVKDLNNAIQAEPYLVGKIVAERGVGDRIVLRSTWTGGSGTFLQDFWVGASGSGELGFQQGSAVDNGDGTISLLEGQTSSVSQVAGVSLRAERDVSSQFGRLTDRATFEITLNDDATATPVTIEWEDTRTNTSVAALVSDINDAIDATALKGKIRAEVSGNFRLVLRAIDESVRKFTLAAAADDPALTQLGFADGQEAKAVLNVTAGADAPAYIGPREDAHFDVTIDGGVKAGTYAVTVAAYNTYTNRSIFDLVGDVSRALKMAVRQNDSAVVNLSDVLLVGNDGGRLVITARNGSGVTGFHVTADAADPAVVDLKLYSPEDYPTALPDPGLGDITFDANAWDLLIRTGDGQIRPVTLDGVTSIGGVMDAINEQTKDPGPDGIPGNLDDVVTIAASINEARTGLNLEDRTAGDTLFQVDAVNGSGAAYGLGIFASDINSVADVADHWIEGQNIGILKLADRLFLRQVDVATPILRAEITLTTPEPVTMTGNFGFVGVNLTEGTGTIDGEVKFWLADRTSDTLLADLLKGVSQDMDDDGDVDVFDLAAVLDFPSFPLFHGSITFEGVDIEPDLDEIVLGTDPYIELQVVTPGNPFHLAPDAYADGRLDESDFARILPDTDVDWLNILSLANFQEITFADFLPALQGLNDFLQKFAAMQFLADPIPLLGVSFNELVGIAQRFDTAVEEIQKNQAGSIQLVEQKLRESFGLPQGANVFDLKLVNNGDADSDLKDMLRITINLPKSFNQPLPIGIDLSSQIPGVSLLGSAGLGGTGSLDAQFTFGINLDDLDDIVLFTEDALTGIGGHIAANSDTLAFNAALGQLGVFVKEGNANFNLDFGFTAGGATDATIPLNADAISAFTAALTGSADVTLPVFYPTQSDYVGDIDYDATFAISPTGGLDTDPILVVTSNPTGGFESLDYADFSIFDNLSLMIDAGDLLLSNLQDILDGRVFNFSLPIVGDKLGAGADFIEDLRQAIMQPFRNLVENATDATGELVQYFLFAILGPGGAKVTYEVEGVDLIADSLPGLGLLRNLNETPLVDKPSYTASDIGAAIAYTKDLDGQGGNDFAQWNFVLGGSYTPGVSMNFDLGVPALGFSGDVGLDVDIDWTLGLGFGISLLDGAYIDISRDDYATPDVEENDPELEITVNAGLTKNTEIEGQLLFLQLDMTNNDSAGTQFAFDTYGDVTPDDNDPTHFFARFTVDLVDQADPDAENLAYSELGNLDTAVTVGADAEVNLGLRLQFNDEILPATISALLPAVQADFVLDWQITDTVLTEDLKLSDGLKHVAFLDVGLDLGSFLGDLVVPIVDKIQEVTEPLQPIVDIVTARIPLISDVAGRTVTLIDLASIFGEINPDLIYALADLITFVNSIPTDIESLVIPIGDFTLYGSGIVSAEDLFNPNFDFKNISDFDTQVSGMLDSASQLFNAAGEFVGNLGGGATADALSGLLGGQYNTETENGKYGFDFPLLKNPANILGLLVGRPVTLITYDLPPFFMDFTWEQGFPVYPPLNVVVSVGVGLKIDLAFGYDTQGVADFMESYNPLDLLSGLFISDTDKPDGTFGTDVPELVFQGSIGVGAELNLGIASAGVKADVVVTVNFDLYDPNSDGKVRINELVGNFLFELENGEAWRAPLAIFDIYGDIALQLSAYIEILMARFDFDITPPITLFDFKVNFERMPILATKRGDDSLLLNIGPSSGARLNGDTRDLPETIYASGGPGNISVWGFGVDQASAQTYSGNKIIVYGGEGDDVIDLRGVTVPVEIYGGGGNDTIYAGSGGSIIHGGLGDDTIYGGSGKDIIFGEEGHDTIYGGGGDDYIFGDKGMITDLGGGKERIACLPGSKDGNDTIDGGDGNDIIFGGGGDDTISGGANDDLIFGDGGRMTWIVGTIPTQADGTLDFDDADGDGLSISTRSLRAGNDTIYGNAGADKIFGGKGNDFIDGGADNDLLYGNEGFDTVYGGSGADTIYGGTEDDFIFGKRDPEGAKFGFAGDTADTAEDGADVIYGENGNDYIRGNEGNDVIYGGRGADIIFGDTGDDAIYGQDGPDILFGGAGNDIITADTGNDIVFGDDGAVVYFNFYPASAADEFIATGSRVRRTADGHRVIGDGGGADADAISDLIGGSVSDGNFRTMDLIVTDVKSTDGNDIIAGGEGDDIVLGGAGNDWIGGDIPVIQTDANGAPVLFATGTGDIDLASGGSVKLITQLPEIRPVGKDVLIGDGGRIELRNRLYSKIATVIDENDPPLPGADHLFGDNGPDIAFGGTGNDVIYGGYRGDSSLGPVEPVLGEDENPTPGNYNDNDILLGDNGVIEYAAGIIKKIYTSDDKETTGGADTIYGQEGSDIILGGVNNGGVDRLNGDTETRVFDLRPQDVILGDNGLLDFDYGDAAHNLGTLDLIRSTPYALDGTTVLGGTDVISGNQGDDVLIGGPGGDTMYGDNADASAGAYDGDDIMLGDNADIFLVGTVGRLKVKVAAMPNGTAVDLITTTDTEEATGGADTMSGNAGNDIMLGGVNNDDGLGLPEIDRLYGDRAVPTPTTVATDSDDILIGDNGLLDFTFDTDTDRNTLDLIRSAQDGRGGVDILSGNKGLDVAIGGTAGDTIYGDDDEASAGADDLGDLLLGDNADIFPVALGGAAGGDLKTVLGAAVKTIRTTDEEHPEYGGSDVISGNAAGDIIAGGVFGDILYGDCASPTDESIAHEGDDIILGDNGAFEWLSTGRLDEITGIDLAANNPDLVDNDGKGWPDTDLTTLDLVTTEQPTRGGRDLIYGDQGQDLIFGGTDADTIYGDDGTLDEIPDSANNDLLFGDHGRIYPQFSMLADFNSRNFFALDTGKDDGGAGDRMWGEEGDDTMLGQQGDDRMWGGAGDDDMTGGHNVSGGWDELGALGVIGASLMDAILVPVIGDVNDLMDGGTGNDSMAGDNAIIWRRGDDLSPRFRELIEASIYTTGAETITANIGGLWQSDPADAVGRDVRLIDHSDTTAAGLYGSDVIAGGADSDVMFGELGNDLMQGDGAIESSEVADPQDFGFISRPITIVDTGTNPDTDETLYFNIPELLSDADDYLEGNGGSDLMYGGLGQDDMIGGSSELFGLITEAMRPDGSDVIFGGAGIAIDRNDIGDTSFGLASVNATDNSIVTAPTGHARDADFIMGDNANVYRLVNPATDAFLTFNYDNYGSLKIIPRAMQQLDYTLGGADYNEGTYVDGAAALTGRPADNGAADLIHGESGDDIIFGMTGSDVIFGEGQDDDIVGGYGHDWISGGTGQDGILGDDGLIRTSRNSTVGEPLNGVAGLLANDPRPKYADGNVLDEVIKTPGEIQYAVINISGELQKAADLVPFSYDPDWIAMDDEFPDNQDTPYADDIIFGGLGSDWLHGGSGDDAISGAEALAHAYVPTYDANGVPNGVLDLGYAAIGLPSPVNPGDVLAFNPMDPDGGHLNNRFRAGEFALYDEYNPLRKILLTGTGELSDSGTGYEFLLNFNETEGVVRSAGTVSKATGQQTESYPAVNDDGRDVIFGDLGNDWLVGGTGRDNLYGGWGNDLLNVDDDQTTDGSLNDMPDTHPHLWWSAPGGAGRDVLIGNSGGDRLIDWVGEYNSYLVPYAPFGQPSVSRTLQPFLPEFLYALSAGDGADPTRPGDTGADPLRDGEPDAEMGLVLQKDSAWQDQTGAPADPQAGNIPGGPRDVLRSASFNDGTAQGFYIDTGTWIVTAGRYQVAPTTKGADAVSVFYIDQYIPTYFEMLATINAVKPTSGYNANAYLVFDYQSATDFKFAGINVSTNKLEIGYRNASGWKVVAQKPYTTALKSDTDYNVFVALNGTNIILTVNNQVSLSYTFAPRVDAYGISHGFKDGMVGLGTNNGKAKIDNVVVQRVAPVLTVNKTVDFSSGTTGLFETPSSGTWTLAGGHYAGTAGTTPAVVLTSVNVGASYLIDFSATFRTTGEGGFVYDRYAIDDFKFVTLSAGKIMLGHRTAKGWFTDAVYNNATLATGTDYTLGLLLKGTTVSVTWNGQTVLSRTYNALVTDGDFGLLGRSGVTLFDTVTFKSDAPTLASATFLHAVAPGPGVEPGASLSADALMPVVGEAIDRWASTLNLDAAQRALLGSVSFQIADLGGLILGETQGITVLIDTDAAGYGWFVDTTPDDDAEFRTTGGDGALVAKLSSQAAGKVDLLTAVMHEFGHVLGFVDLDAGTDAADVMFKALTAGIRRTETEFLGETGATLSETGMGFSGGVSKRVHFLFDDWLSDWLRQ